MRTPLYKSHIKNWFSDGRIRNEQIVAAPFLGEYRLKIMAIIKGVSGTVPSELTL